MNIQLFRYDQGTESTLSNLFVNKVMFGNVLEDTDRGLTSAMSVAETKKIKVWGRTAFGTGRYPVKMAYSPHFKRMMPEIKNIVAFDKVYFHWGNTVANTDACPLTGNNPDKDQLGYWRVWNSKVTFEKLLKEIISADLRKEPIWCEVSRLYTVR